ncbi:MAG: HPr family phosphocarrier protein [Lachnospiraceae bacterium]
MKTLTYIITDSNGIHARPAGLLVKEAGKFESKITIAKEGKTVDAKRIMALMSLGVKMGHEVTLTIEGNDEEEAFTALERFLKENL